MPAGRPSLLTRATFDAIVRDMEAGQEVRVACARNGINTDTYYEWERTAARAKRKRNRTPDAPLTEHELRCIEFSVARERAEASSISRLDALIQKAASGDWRAAAWWLERRHPGMYGERRFNEHTGADGGPIQIGADALVAKLQAAQARNAGELAPGLRALPAAGDDEDEEAASAQ